MKHFYRSLELSRERALRNTVNVWDHMSRCLESDGPSVVTQTGLAFSKGKNVRAHLAGRVYDVFPYPVLDPNSFSLLNVRSQASRG